MVRIKIMKLSDYAENNYSQAGEDGIINKIFEIIKPRYNTCVEFGAWDGIYCSNTANLWKKGWKTVLIESNEQRFKILKEKTTGFNVVCIREFVEISGENTIENILIRYNIPLEIDLLSIDIDGDDYYILKSLEQLKPRVIVCEYNSTIPPELELVPQPKNYFGCSALSLTKLAEEKGYFLVSATRMNCIFVKSEYSDLFSEYQTDLNEIIPRDKICYLITGFDGDFILSKKPRHGFAFPSKQKFISGDVYQTSLPKMIYSKMHQKFFSSKIYQSLITKLRRGSR